MATRTPRPNAEDVLRSIAGVAVVTTDLGGVITSANPAVTAVLGAEGPPEGCLARVLPGAAAALRPGAATVVEDRIVRRSDATEAVLSAAVSELRDAEDHHIGYVVVVTD